MTTFTKISDLPVVNSLTDNDKFIVETATGTKAVTRVALKEEVEITPADIGLGNVDNTHDLDKPISTATQEALNAITTSYLPSATASSLYPTKTEVANTYLAQNIASGTYLSKNDAANFYVSKEVAGTLYVTKTEATSIYATQTEMASMLPSETAATIYATKTELGEYTALVGSTYATQTEMASMLPSATAETVYATKTELGEYTALVGSTYATQTEMASMLPSETAATVYATKTEALENITTNTFTELATTTQTVIGAINELNSIIGDATTALAAL